MREDDLKLKGFVKRPDGEWEKAKQTNEDHRSASSPKPQQVVRDESVGASTRTKSNPRRCRVSVVSFRKRLIDPDNLCAKFFIDGLRYCGAIADDTAKHVSVEVSQEQSDFERTEIDITPL